MSDLILLQCYNRGCGNKYRKEDNNESSCQHHPGQPVFHDAYKSWSCCKRKTTDFTEFLNIKGCTKSYHSNIKPPEPEKPAGSDEVAEINNPPSGQVVSNKPIYVPLERPPVDMPMKKLKFIVSEPLQRVLNTLIVNPQNCDGNSNEDKPNENEIEIGTACKNYGCKKVWLGPDSQFETCIYHSGYPIFHEGLKYWTCCQRKTTDFDAFLEQSGCENGSHLWFKSKREDNPDLTKTCRFDYFQSGPFIVFSIYAKQSVPTMCNVEGNSVRLAVRITFGGMDQKEYAFDEILFGLIDIEESYVNFLTTKVEIHLKKAEPVNWTKLILPSSNSN